MLTLQAGLKNFKANFLAKGNGRFRLFAFDRVNFLIRSFFILQLFCNYSYSSNFVVISAGSFTMGDNKVQDDESPVHNPYLESFEISRFEITITEWEAIRSWAVHRGYSFSDPSKSPWSAPYWYPEVDWELFPMNKVNWYDAVKWCNAKSEYEGRSVVYYTDSNHSEIYRSGQVDLEISFVDWDSIGYRLPTEEEWEKAARGGVSGYDYPWGNKIDGSKANYKNSGDLLDNRATPVGYFNGNQQISSATNSLGGESRYTEDTANLYGLYDVIGNVGEWCWDWYDSGWYKDKSSSKTKAYGPNISVLNTDSRSRVFRGGSFMDGPSLEKEGKPLRVAFRHLEYPYINRKSIGFRAVRSYISEDLWMLTKELVPEAVNWYRIYWFGDFYQGADNWIFHSNFGWVYPSLIKTEGKWIYFPHCGWMWTASSVYPYFFNNLELGWFLCLFQTDEVGVFQSVYDGSLRYWGESGVGTASEGN